MLEQLQVDLVHEVTRPFNTLHVIRDIKAAVRSGYIPCCFLGASEAWFHMLDWNRKLPVMEAQQIQTGTVISQPLSEELSHLHLMSIARFVSHF